MKTLHSFVADLTAPPLSKKALNKAVYLLRLAQQGEHPGKRMKGIGNGVHQLRVSDKNQSWRVIYFTDADRVVTLYVYSKKTQKTPKRVVDICKRRVKSLTSD